METRIIKKSVTHQDIGGKVFKIDKEISATLNAEEVFYLALEGNWACKNFIDRRSDFDKNFNKRLYYGKVGNLGYIVAEDEFEEE